MSKAPVLNESFLNSQEEMLLVCFITSIIYFNLGCKYEEKVYEFGKYLIIFSNYRSVKYFINSRSGIVALKPIPALIHDVFTSIGIKNS